MWVADICFERKAGLDKEFIRCGKLWHNGERGFLRLAMIPMVACGPHGMTLFGNAFRDIEAPYIQGDITAEGNFLPVSTIKKQYRCGIIYTESNEVGKAQYIIVLFANPWPIFESRKRREDTGRYGEGIILNINEGAES